MKTILVVEDDQKLAWALTARLKGQGYRVLTASDALSGVSTAVKHKPDMIILDVSMPAGGGFSVAERIQNQIPIAVPIVFITGNRDPETRRRAEALGAAGFFEKPYDGEVLLATIERSLGAA